MSLAKTTSLNGIALAVKVTSAVLINKMLAVYFGPTGYVVIGQFQNAVSIVLSLAGGVVTTGVTKATAQHFDDDTKQHAVWQTAIRFSLGASAMVAITLILMRGSLAEWLLHRVDMFSVFVWVALTLPAMAANNLLLAIVNGKKEVGLFVTINIIGSVISFLMVGFLSLNFGLYGALVAFVTSPVILLFSTAAIVSRRDWFKAKFLWGKMNRLVLLELSGFALMGLTSALTVPISYILISDHLANRLGLSFASYWQASWKISEIYLMLVTTTMSTYYLPRIAEIRSATELKAEIFKMYRIVMPIVIVSSIAIYSFRDFVIYILFTPDFLPMRELFPYQLAGDVIKIASWILGYILIGRGMFKFFIFSEIIFSTTLIILSWLFIKEFGSIGAPLAYLATYCLHWIYMTNLVVTELKKMTLLNA